MKQDASTNDARRVVNALNAALILIAFSGLLVLGPYAYAAAVAAFAVVGLAAQAWLDSNTIRGTVVGFFGAFMDGLMGLGKLVRCLRNRTLRPDA
ncbi:MAG: hypothetical protein GVY11_01770 [Gammaproteobacteria bacterium]|jgi:hypothetical protein|nr:hypothetical protein [Gammaproteobacteria bacterium]